MFDGLTSTFQQDIATFKHVLEAHDCARATYEAPPDLWAAVRASNLPKTIWHIYDHCAAFTRLYAIYATYVDELVEEYLAHRSVLTTEFSDAILDRIPGYPPSDVPVLRQPFTLTNNEASQGLIPIARRRVALHSPRIRCAGLGGRATGLAYGVTTLRGYGLQNSVNES
jgi:hypothetical protein